MYGLGVRAISIRVLAGNDVEMLIILAKTVTEVTETALAPKPYMLPSWFASQRCMLNIHCIRKDFERISMDIIKN